MIAYKEKLETFYEDIQKGIIADRIIEKLGRRVGDSERRSYERSLPMLANALHNEDLPLDADVALEFKIPLTSMRIDFMIVGENNESNDDV